MGDAFFWHVRSRSHKIVINKILAPTLANIEMLPSLECASNTEEKLRHVTIFKSSFGQKST